ncbi:MAG TPA: hypothetical protein VEU08_14590 [Vicinamibacterales bacterium]|nr:hypothetical protein [Vicinamibacterales bacterium]
MAQLNNIACYRGEAVTLAFTMTPVTDITGWTITFTLKRNQTDPTPILTIAAVITNGPNGTFTVSLTKAQTNMQAGTYQYDIQRTDAGSEAVLSIGTFTITQEVLN